ncbi:MAG TPA: hypothetical protein VEH04_11005 [Verrucomicrobiae bacterium]|nr:hypothetical protein [Verrucomicrobiae bacterium]
MKIVTYSEVPEKSGPYIHLAYTSASAQYQVHGMFGSGVMMGILYLFILVTATAAKVPASFPRAWRWFSIVFVTITISLLVFSFFIPTFTRGR